MFSSKKDIIRYKLKKTKKFKQDELSDFTEQTSSTSFSNITKNNFNQNQDFGVSKIETVILKIYENNHQLDLSFQNLLNRRISNSPSEFSYLIPECFQNNVNKRLLETKNNVDKLIEIKLNLAEANSLNQDNRRLTNFLLHFNNSNVVIFKILGFTSIIVGGLVIIFNKKNLNKEQNLIETKTPLLKEEINEKKELISVSFFKKFFLEIFFK